MPSASIVKLTSTRVTPRARGLEVAEHEPAEPAVARRELVLALVDLDRDVGLVVLGGREDLLGAGRDAGVRGDHDRHPIAGDLDAHVVRRDVEQDDLLELAAMMPECTAAPIATISSGLTPLLAGLPKIWTARSCTIGIRVMPPTSRT